MSRVQALPLAGQGFANRVSLCAAWRGLRGDDLKKASGFNDIEFVHHGGFIGGAWSFETCLQMAKKSLEEHHTEQEGKKASKVEKMEEEKKNENIFDKIISKEVPAEIILKTICTLPSRMLIHKLLFISLLFQKLTKLEFRTQSQERPLVILW